MSTQEYFNEYTLIDSRLLTPRENRSIARLGDAYGTTATIATTAGVIASTATVATGATVAATATTAATLFGSAAAASAVPVIGWIAAVIAVIAGILVTVFGKRKARKAETKAINAQTAELKVMAYDLEEDRTRVQNQMSVIKNELIRMGYADIANVQFPKLGGLADAKSDLADAKKNFDAWNKIVDNKVQLLEQDKAILERWQDTLTGKKKKEGIIVAVGVLAVIATTLLLLPKSKN